MAHSVPQVARHVAEQGQGMLPQKTCNGLRRAAHHLHQVPRFNVLFQEAATEVHILFEQFQADIHNEGTAAKKLNT